MSTIRYTIDVPQRAIPELQALMDKHGAHFDPVRQVTAINEPLMEAYTAMATTSPTWWKP